MRKTKSEGKTVGIFANCSQCVANFAMRNFAMRKTTAQCEKPFGNAKIHLAMRKSIWQCEKPFGNAKNHLAMRKSIWQCEKPFGNFAMRNFAMRKPHCKFRNAKRKFRNAKWLPTVCENSCFSFSLLIFNICSKICTKLLKLKQ